MMDMNVVVKTEHIKWIKSYLYTVWGSWKELMESAIGV